MEIVSAVIIIIVLLVAVITMLCDDVEGKKKISSEQKREYTDEEIEEAWKAINDYINGVPPSVGDFIVGAGCWYAGWWFGKVCFLPLLIFYTMLNCIGPLSGPLDVIGWLNKGNNGMFVLMGIVQLFILVFAIIGVVLSFIEFFGYDKKSIIEKNLKELAEKVQIALKENEESYEAEIEDLNSQIDDLQNDKELLEEQLKDNESSIKNKLKQMKDMYDREKRLMMLENKELRVKLKYSNTLKDELNEDSPLNGLYE